MSTLTPLLSVLHSAGSNTRSNNMMDHEWMTEEREIALSAAKLCWKPISQVTPSFTASWDFTYRFRSKTILVSQELGSYERLPIVPHWIECFGVVHRRRNGGANVKTAGREYLFAQKKNSQISTIISVADGCLKMYIMLCKISLHFYMCCLIPGTSLPLPLPLPSGREPLSCPALRPY